MATGRNSEQNIIWYDEQIEALQSDMAEAMKHVGILRNAHQLQRLESLMLACSQKLSALFVARQTQLSLNELEEEKKIQRLGQKFSA